MKQGKEHYKNHRFPGQKAGENIQLLITKHWIIDVKIAAILLVIGLMPLILGITTEFFVWNGSFNDTFLTIALAFVLYFMVVLFVAYEKWLNEELDVVVVTETRIISHEQVDLFHRQISEANLTQVQDVMGSQKGFMQSMFQYGDIEIQTSASDTFFLIKHVNNPYENARAILDLRDSITPAHD